MKKRKKSVFYIFCYNYYFFLRSVFFSLAEGLQMSNLSAEPCSSFASLQVSFSKLNEVSIDLELTPMFLMAKTTHQARK